VNFFFLAAFRSWVSCVSPIAKALLPRVGFIVKLCLSLLRRGANLTPSPGWDTSFGQFKVAARTRFLDGLLPGPPWGPPTRERKITPSSGVMSVRETWICFFLCFFFLLGSPSAREPVRTSDGEHAAAFLNRRARCFPLRRASISTFLKVFLVTLPRRSIHESSPTISCDGAGESVPCPSKLRARFIRYSAENIADGFRQLLALHGLSLML